jgi:hypothetical protein
MGVLTNSPGCVLSSHSLHLLIDRDRICAFKIFAAQARLKRYRNEMPRLPV